MRPGIPLIPILKQQRLEESSGGKLRSTPRRSGDPPSARHSDSSARQVGQGEGTPPTLLHARRSEGGLGRRPHRSAHLGAGSTGGTGSSGNIAGFGAFWSHIDDLDADLQIRAAAVQGKKRDTHSASSTPKGVGFPRTPDTNSKDISFVQTPDHTSQDIIFPETPKFLPNGEGTSSVVEDVSFVEGSPCLEENNTEPARSRGSNDVAWLGGVLDGGAEPRHEEGHRSLQSSPLGSPSASAGSPRQFQRGGRATDTRNTPAAATSPGSQASSSSRRARTPTGIGARPSRGGLQGRASVTQSDDTVAVLTTRIRQLEGELENAFDALQQGQPAANKRLPRRSGSAPPTRRKQAPLLCDPPSSQRLPPESPQVAPRIMCRETLGEAEGAPNLDAGIMLRSAVEGQRENFRTEEDVASWPPSRLAHICQMMQLERREFLDALQDACRRCEVGFEATDPQAGEVYQADEGVELTKGANSPRALIHRLCDSHAALRMHCDALAETTIGAGCAGREVVDLENGSAAAQAWPESGISPAMAAILTKGSDSRTDALVQTCTSRPFAAATLQLRSFLESVKAGAPASSAMSREAQEDLLELLAVAREAQDAMLASTRPQLETDERVSVLSSHTDTFRVSLVSSSEESVLIPTMPVSLAPDAAEVGRESHSSGYSCGPLSPYSSAVLADFPRSPISLATPVRQESSATGRLGELVAEKRREVEELEARCEHLTNSEEQLDASMLLTSARQELRLLQEFLGEE